MTNVEKLRELMNTSNIKSSVNVITSIYNNKPIPNIFKLEDDKQTIYKFIEKNKELLDKVNEEIKEGERLRNGILTKFKCINNDCCKDLEIGEYYYGYKSTTNTDCYTILICRINNRIMNKFWVDYNINRFEIIK